MKKYLILISLLSLSINLSAQNSLSRIQAKCKNIYVWDFLDEDKNKNRTTNDLTEAVEEALINMGECVVLQRRNLATLINHAAAEKGVNSVREMKREMTSALSGRGAKLVLFGSIDMSARDACEVKLRVEDLETSRIVTAKSTRILYSEIADIDNRNMVINRLVCLLVGKVYVLPKSTRQSSPMMKSMSGSNIGEPKAPAPTRKNFTMSTKADLGLTVGECIGNSYSQTVTINFTFTNNSPNLELGFKGLYNNFASDEDGNQFAPTAASLGGSIASGTYSTVEKEFYTGTKLRGSITFGNILPRVKKLSVAKVVFSTQLRGASSNNGEIAFRDMEINWR